jgi:hypothetical protein
VSIEYPPRGKRNGNGWQWSFHKCKGIIVNERSKGGKKVLKHEVFIQEVLLLHDKAF